MSNQNQVESLSELMVSLYEQGFQDAMELMAEIAETKPFKGKETRDQTIAGIKEHIDKILGTRE